MKRPRILGLCLIAAFVTSAAASGSASAVAPEYGRCLKYTLVPASAHSLTYSNAGCTQTNAGTTEKNWEWYPYPTTPAGKPGAKFGYTTHLKPGTLAVLELTNGNKVVCSKETGTGGGWAPKEANSTSLALEECASGIYPCQSPNQAAGTIVLPDEGSQELGALLGWINQSLLKVGAVLRPRIEIGLMEFKCNGGPFATGEYIEGWEHGTVSPVKSGKMVLSETIKYTAKHGVQIPAGLEGYSFAPPEIGLSMTIIRTNEEKIEINPVV